MDTGKNIPMESNKKSDEHHRTHTCTCTCGSDQHDNDQSIETKHEAEAEAELEILRTEILDLQFQVESLRKLINNLQVYAYKHRHQIGAGHFSDRGVE